MDKCKLKLYSPPIDGYCMHAYPLSAIEPAQDYYDWLYANYINLYCHTDFTRCRVPLNFCTDGVHSEYNGLYYYDVTNFLFSIPFLQIQHFQVGVLSQLKNDIADFFCNIIDSGSYIFTYVDEYYVPNRHAYQSNHNHHEIFIFGYDKALKSFDIFGYTAKGILEKTLLNFEDFIQAFRGGELFDLPCFRKNIYILTNHVPVNMTLSKKYIIQQLSNYLYSTNNPILSDQGYLAFGFDVYDSLINIIIGRYKSNAYCDFRPFYLLREHKTMMIRRIKHWHGTDFLHSEHIYENLLNVYMMLEAKYNAIINLAIKYNMIKKDAILLEISSKIANDVDLEKEAIHLLLNEISP